MLLISRLAGVLANNRLSALDVSDVRGGIAQLREIRSSVYEDLNQIQHEYLLLRGLEWLLDNGFDSKVVWEWNRGCYETQCSKPTHHWCNSRVVGKPLGA
jgi:hypothetical protein